MSREVASELWLPDKDVAIAMEEDMSGAVQGQQGLALLGGAGTACLQGPHECCDWCWVPAGSRDQGVGRW